MTESAAGRARMAVLGQGLCLPEPAVAEQHGFSDCALDASLLPPLVRRRTSLATRMAVSAADRACAAAGTGRDLSAIFVSAVGEMQVTDRLCSAIARQQYPLSPTLFHNSVHNTAAGYWSMAIGSMAPMQAMAALDDGFALGLLEAWCQLQAGVDRVLLVTYDEVLPDQLLPGSEWQNAAFALVLGRDTRGKACVTPPVRVETPARVEAAARLRGANPALAAAALFQALERAEAGCHRIPLCASGACEWFADLQVPR